MKAFKIDLVLSLSLSLSFCHFFIVSLYSRSLSSMQMVSEELGHNESHATKKLPVEPLIFEDIPLDAQQVSK